MSSSTSNSACNNQHVDFPIAQFDFDTIDIAILNIIRLICAGFSGSSDTSIDEAYALSAQIGTSARQQEVFDAAVEMTDAIKQNRRAPFQFMSAQCEQCKLNICPDEIDLMGLIKGSRQKDASKIIGYAKLVAISDNTLDLVFSAYQLADLMNSHTRQNMTLDNPVSFVSTTIH